jgi:hypothetical protein
VYYTGQHETCTYLTGLLGLSPHKVSQRNPDEFLVSDSAGAGGTLYFMKVPEPKVGKNRPHVAL